MVSYQPSDFERQINRIVVAEKANVLEQAKILFGVTDRCSVEYFHEEFKEFVEPANPQELPDGGKLRLLREDLKLASPGSASTILLLNPPSSEVTG